MKFKITNVFSLQIVFLKAGRKLGKFDKFDKFGKPFFRSTKILTYFHTIFLKIEKIDSKQGKAMNY